MTNKRINVLKQIKSKLIFGSEHFFPIIFYTSCMYDPNGPLVFFLSLFFPSLNQLSLKDVFNKISNENKGTCYACITIIIISSIVSSNKSL